MPMIPSPMRFRTASVTVHQGHVETFFTEDGSLARADAPWGDTDHIAACWTAGYGGDQWRMVVEHEVGHSFIADEMGWPHSWSVWAAAHGSGHRTAESLWPQRIKDEEHLVVSLQRHLNHDLRDPYDILGKTFGERLPEVAQRFAAIARPWRSPGYVEPF